MNSIGIRLAIKGRFAHIEHKQLFSTQTSQDIWRSSGETAWVLLLLSPPLLLLLAREAHNCYRMQDIAPAQEL